VQQQLILALYPSTNMIRHLVQIPFGNLSTKFVAIQQFLTDTLFNKIHIGPLMAQPYEIIDVSTADTQEDTKSSEKPNG
jgi:GH25 family lysozyme M1 (1,4-beta-N-acetylmuramidase)